MLIYIKGVYTILGKIEYKPDKTEFDFTVNINNEDVIVKINPQQKRIEANSQFEISDELMDVLKSGITDGHKLPKGVNDVLSEISSALSTATRKVMTILKYGLNQTGITESLFSIKEVFWSNDKTNWKNFPMTLSLAGTVLDFAFLNTRNALDVQKYIDNNFEPFFALYHLHLAKNALSPRSKWINATIAAELAIKEFLLQKEPSLESLLLEVPSPPIHKLYGKILEAYASVRSPKLTELSKGVEIRNKLIHRPEDLEIALQDAFDYVQDVEIAIFHLMTLLYPSDRLVKNFYNRRIFITKK